MKIKKKKGFTLIELLIVVAIIAILAAIAIPQFSQYRIRGYNTGAVSDLRNAKTAEEALFADFQAYGSTLAAAVITTANAPIYTQDSSGNSRNINVGLSANVHIMAKTDVAAGAAGSSYLAFTKHLQGDRTFGADNAATTIYWKESSINVALEANPSASASTAAVDITSVGWTAL